MVSCDLQTAADSRSGLRNQRWKQTADDGETLRSNIHVYIHIIFTVLHRDNNSPIKQINRHRYTNMFIMVLKQQNSSITRNIMAFIIDQSFSQHTFIAAASPDFMFSISLGLDI